MKPTTLALHLEGTLISNAVSQIPRPGLFQFLEHVRLQFVQQVLFTTVPEPLAREICELLAGEGAAPPWFASIRCSSWDGPTKDPRFLASEASPALQLDDHVSYVHPGQEHQWVEIPLFGSPYPGDDIGLSLARLRIDERLSTSPCTT